MSIDDHETTIYGENKAAVMTVTEDLIELIKEQIADTDHNYGLAQNNFVKYYADEYGVTVF